MFISLFDTLKRAGVPVSLRELLDLHAVVERGVVFADMEAFYQVARTVMVKDERYFDRFDRAFAAWFKGIEDMDAAIEALIPDEWLRREFEKQLSDEEKAKIESLGGLEELIETFKTARRAERAPRRRQQVDWHRWHQPFWRLRLQSGRHSYWSGWLAPPPRHQGMGRTALSRLR